MPRLPDRFDLWVRRARAHADPARQADYILGALMARPEWHFLNAGTPEKPHPASAEVEGAPHLLVFSGLDRVLEIAEQMGRPAAGSAIAIPSAQALDWCVEERPGQCAGILLNPGEDAVVLPLEYLADFAREWKARGAEPRAGFWIPHSTSEEEDFWQEHGL